MRHQSAKKWAPWRVLYHILTIGSSIHDFQKRTLTRQTTGQLSTSPQSILNELGPREGGSMSGLVYIRFPPCVVEFHPYVCGCSDALCSQSVVFRKCSWAHAVTSTTELCLFLQCRLRARRPRPSNFGFRPCPSRTEISLDSLNLLIMMYCRRTNPQILLNFTLRNIILKLLHYFPVQSFTVRCTSPHLYIRKTQPLWDALFISSHVTNLLQVNLINCEMFHHIP